MPQLLLELLSEEIPARMQARAAQDLKRMVGEGMGAAGIPIEHARVFVTPRRLTLVLDHVPVAQPDTAEERRGPRTDAPDAAIQGFLRGAGIAIEQAERRTTPKGEFFFATVTKKGRPTAEVIKEVVEATMANFPWPKSMRWGTGRDRWVRPLHRILCAFNKEVVPIRFAGIEAGDMTEGHRFLGAVSFPVRGFDCYERGLRETHVILDADERARIVRAESERLAAAENLTVQTDEALLAEVVGLVEWPVPLMGRIDDAFMSVPPEVLTTAMRTHQKYFSLLHADGTMAARFLAVANMEAADGGKAIVAGNERVLRARLSDAKFFWDQDRKHTLESRMPKLAERVFHARLGSVADKVERIRTLAAALLQYVPGANAAEVDRAALLCKADLSTGMVGEFPELQGIMGRYYGRHDGEAPAVCDAIAQHYSPAGPSDVCPARPASMCIALADRIDTLVGFWAIDEKPTGSKDPFALRRAALGVIRLVLENGLRLPLRAAFRTGLFGYSRSKFGTEPGANRPKFAAAAEELVPSLLEFFADRLKVHLRERGVRHDLIAAIFALGGEDDLVRLLARVDALGRFLGSDDGANLLTAYRRANNIVRIEEKKDKASYSGPVTEPLLTQDEERRLFAALAEVERDSAKAVEGERFDQAMSMLARLRSPVDAFFERVTVNTEKADLRDNRLRLLSSIGSAMGTIADFSRIEG